MERYLISVVTHNSEEHLPGLLADIGVATQTCAENGIELTAKFFDNCSTDRTPELVREHGLSADLNLSERNIGFGAGHNRNFETTESDVVIVCNPDIRFEPSIFEAIRERFITDATIGILLPRLFYPDGNEQHMCKRNPTFLDIFLRRFAPRAVKRIFAERMKRYVMEDHDYGSEFEVEYGSGSFMAVRSAAYAQVGGFDERYFMYIEDADITREVTSRGYRCIYTPGVAVVHSYQKGSYSSKRLAWINIVSVIKYLAKWNLGLNRRPDRLSAPSGAGFRLPEEYEGR